MARQAPLSGIRVCDFTWVWAGPYCTMQLAHLGAEVIRIETRTRPCVTRMLPPWLDGVFNGVNRSGYYNQYNQGKKSISLNFKHPEAKEVARKLISQSDILVNNFAGGVIEKMGFGYEEAKKLRPNIIMVTLTGYGDYGPYKDFVAYGPAQVPLSGLSSLTGYRGFPPMHSGFSYADPNAGIHGALAIMNALYHRAKTGEGQYIEMSQWECAIDVLPEGLMEYTMNGVNPERNGNRDPYMAPHQSFKCKDWPEKILDQVVDRWISIVCADDAEWGRLANAIGRPELANDPKFNTLQARRQNEDQLEAIIQEWTLPQVAEEAVAKLQKAGVAAAVVSDAHYLSEDPNLTERNYFVYREHPEVGKRQHCGMPWRMSGTPTEVRAAAPVLGQNTDEVLAMLGYKQDDIEGLRNKGALD